MNIKASQSSLDKDKGFDRATFKIFDNFNELKYSLFEYKIN